MVIRTKLAMTALTAALVLAATVSTASANRFALSNQHIRIVWSFLKISFGNFALECPVTLEGSFHSRTLSKVPGQLVGAITQGAIGAFASCRNRENVTAIVILQGTLPWHLQYDSFVGTLPNISEIRHRLIGAGFLVTAFGVSCLYKSTTARPLLADARRNTTTGNVVDLVPLATQAIPLFEGSSILCPASTVLANGTGVVATVTLQGSSTAIYVSLVQ